MAALLKIVGPFESSRKQVIHQLFFMASIYAVGGGLRSKKNWSRNLLRGMHNECKRTDVWNEAQSNGLKNYPVCRRKCSACGAPIQQPGDIGIPIYILVNFHLEGNIKKIHPFSLPEFLNTFAQSREIQDDRHFTHEITRIVNKIMLLWEINS